MANTIFIEARWDVQLEVFRQATEVIQFNFCYVQQNIYKFCELSKLNKVKHNPGRWLCLTSFMFNLSMGNYRT